MNGYFSMLIENPWDALMGRRRMNASSDGHDNDNFNTMRAVLGWADRE
jgi:hypothetical protein